MAIVSGRLEEQRPREVDVVVDLCECPAPLRRLSLCASSGRNKKGASELVRLQRLQMLQCRIEHSHLGRWHRTFVTGR